MAVHPDLIELVRCPRCRGKLALATGPAGPQGSASEGFECHACRVSYPVDASGIPQLLLDEARPIPERAPVTQEAGA